jgi:chromosome segregation ATPase
VTEPAITEWRAAIGQSTSAQLRDTQAALFASQADLTRAKDELAEATQLNTELRAEADELRAQVLAAAEQAETLRQVIADTMRDLNRVGNERDSLRIELRAAYRSLGDVEAEANQLRRQRAEATVNWHAAEKELRSEIETLRIPNPKETP